MSQTQLKSVENELEESEAEALVAEFTRELFPGPLTIEYSDDPEIAGLRFTVFRVRVKGTPEEVVERSREWDLRLIQSAMSRATRYCLQCEFA